MRTTEPEVLPSEFEFVKTIEEADALFRSFGNSKGFPWGSLTTDIDRFGYLKDCSVYYVKIKDESVFDTFKRFEYGDLTFTAAGGNTFQKNPHGVKISKRDVIDSFKKYYGNEEL